MLKKSLIMAFAIIAIDGAEKIPFQIFPRFTFVRIGNPFTVVPVPSAPAIAGAAIAAPITVAPVTATPVTAAPAQVEEYPRPLPLWPGADICTGDNIYGNDCNICRCGFDPPCSTIDCSLVPEEVKKQNAFGVLSRWRGRGSPTVFGQLYTTECGLCVGNSPRGVSCIVNCAKVINFKKS